MKFLNSAINRVWNSIYEIERHVDPCPNRFWDNLSQKDKKVFLDTIEHLKDRECKTVILDSQEYEICK